MSFTLKPDTSYELSVNLGGCSITSNVSMVEGDMVHVVFHRTDDDGLDYNKFEAFFTRSEFVHFKDFFGEMSFE